MMDTIPADGLTNNNLSHLLLAYNVDLIATVWLMFLRAVNSTLVINQRAYLLPRRLLLFIFPLQTHL